MKVNNDVLYLSYLKSLSCKFVLQYFRWIKHYPINTITAQLNKHEIISVAHMDVW